MNISVIGAGALGSNAARLLAKSGVSATIANSRGPQSLARLVGELGPSVKAGSVEEAASPDIVLVAVRWVDLEKALSGLPAWNDRIVIDGTNLPDSWTLTHPTRRTRPICSLLMASRQLILAVSIQAKYSARSFRAHAWSRHSTTSTPTSCPSRRRQVVKGLVLFRRRHQCEGRGPQTSRTPRISRSTVVSSTSADRLRHSVRLSCRH
jgi:hypothetical protein